MSGVADAGLKTTALPYTSAGAIFQAGMAIGKFHGVIAATTPSGSRRLYSIACGALAGRTSPPNRQPSPP